MNKKYLVSIVLIGVIAFAFYYKNNNKIKQPKLGDVKIAGMSSSTAVVEYQVQTINSGILVGEKGLYKNLTVENRDIIISFIKNVYKNNSPTQDHLNSTFLKYYDNRIAIFGEYSIKPSVPFYIYDIKNSSLLTGTIKNLNSYVGYTENKQYMVSAYDDGIVYYKAGNYDIKLLPNSALKAGETYSKTNEMVNEYDLSISTSTPAVLKAGVFSDTEYDGNYHKKLREVEYVLP